MSSVRVNDLTLAYREAGHASRPALVLLHGWPHSSAIYAGVLDELGRDSYVLAFDLPGIGDSRGAPPSAEKHVLADIVLAAAETLGARSILIAGFDVGGMIAFAAAREHGSRIVGAAVANTVIPGLEPWSKVSADPRIFHFALHAIPRLPDYAAGLRAGGVTHLDSGTIANSGEYLPVEAPEEFCSRLREFRAAVSAAAK